MRICIAQCGIAVKLEKVNGMLTEMVGRKLNYFRNKWNKVTDHASIWCRQGIMTLAAGEDVGSVTLPLFTLSRKAAGIPEAGCLLSQN